jgi:hypothetical protein
VITEDETPIHGVFNSGDISPHPMTNRKSTLLVAMTPLLLIASFAVAVPNAAAQRVRDREQDAAMAATKRGMIRPLRQIENQIVPGMRARGAQYIGFEYDAPLYRYRLKFMREASVIWVDVDGKSGAVIAQAGN